ncbi:FGGY-family carbohydrate kinase [Arenibacter echinorum]|uniref:Sugar (Pentulose or hexulose) kinase n=1 Tax=Arenibacter echinorum TaxID=440515 RepID=A0A327RK63_9FLAO|nr:FGGY family carbohydrate kinase [Arenibacter echinorum]RAJ15954.1 sugar (pentulose or hexulose) kinase [Arenibacter echinorum]
MKKNVTAVFDIGRTNKKFFLFDSDFQEVYREYNRFDEITDEDGYPTENLEALEKWVKEVFDRMMDSPEFEIQALNFSCYGASLVHINENGKVLTPLYNYIKPLKAEVYETFYDKYGPENELSRITGSQKLGMLNTGMHLYWLKYASPKVYNQIKYSLHLPQYLSYLFTGIAVSEFTSIGCHTMLWDFEKKDYHKWVYQEEINEKLPPICSSRETTPINYKGRIIQIGAGIHDSSSALLPYIRSIKKPFLLVSTGTWSISINPFNKGMLTIDDIGKGCLFNMRIDGSPVKVSTLFLGNEYKLQIKALSTHFNVPDDYHKTVKFDQDIFYEIKKDFLYMFKWMSITSENMPEETEITYDRFEHAYHQLMLELVLLQVKSIRSAIGDANIGRLYVDGGFSDNEVYIHLLSQYLANIKISTTDSSLGSALGAAIVISDITLEPKFLKKNYSLKKHVPLIIQ